MATMAENVIAAGSKTCPPMLEKGMYDSWKTRIMIYIRGKENGEMLRDSVENGPYKFKSKITAKDTDGVTNIRCAERLEDLKGDDKLIYDSDIKVVNILLLGLPVEIYTLINHYQTAKEIWDRVKELMEGTKMTKQEREFMLYDEFDKFTSDPGESIHSYYLKFTKLINEMNMISMIMTPMQLNTKFVNHLQPEWSRFSEPLALLANTYNPPPSYNSNAGNNHASGAWVINAVRNTRENQPRVIKCYNCKGEGHMAKQCTTRKKVKDSEWFKDKMLLAQAQEAGVVLDEEQHDFLADSLEETDECEDLQLQATPNFKPDHADIYDSDCDDEATTNSIFMANLSLVGSLNDDTIAPHYDSNTLSELDRNNMHVLIAKEHNPVSTCDSEETLILAEEEQLYWSSILSPLVSVSKPKVFPKKLPSTSQVLRNLNNARDLLTKFDEFIKRRTTLSPHEIGSWEQSDIKVKEREHIKLEYNNLYDSIKLTWAKMKLQTDSLQQKLNDQISENNKLRAQLKGKFFESQMNHNGTSVNTRISKSSTLGTKLYSVILFPKSKVIPKVVKKNDSSKSITSHLTTNKIIEKCTKVLASVYVSAFCPFTQSGNEKWAPATSHRKNNKPYVDASRTKQTIETITKEHAVKQNTRKTDNTMLPSTGKVSSTNVSGSKPRSNTENDRVPQPSSRSMKNNVEAHHRRFKSSANKNTHVSDCNVNVKNVALSKNSDTICLSCNECLFSANHDACVIQYLKKMQKRKVPKSTKQKVKREWKPPRWIFKIIIEIVFWYLDSGCSKYKTGHRDKLIIFVSKFIRTVRFGNNHFAAIMGYGDLQMGNIFISRVYYVEGLCHNLLFVGKFCDSDLEVAFRKHTCFVQNLEGYDEVFSNLSTLQFLKDEILVMAQSSLT
ncbi:integrase, catalytic region, zinc finger, CCHC-type containing protein [Tanacetum coccineum]|uniref:Integrase, catalytic region, zinc finger, CCHC-type containing protein n=1 Tax=Tanacetum coccineum TaxID=301880 RepID=A0ABQ4XQB9_9ASTR